MNMVRFTGHLLILGQHAVVHNEGGHMSKCSNILSLILVVQWKNTTEIFG